MLLTLLSSFLLSFSPATDTLARRADAVAVVNKTRVLRLVNELRSRGSKCGDTWFPAAPPLIWSDLLEQAAQVHSNDMMSRKYFNHRSPEGDNAGERIDRAGYTWKTFGENIGMGYRSEEEVVRAWQASPGHCRNLMNPKFREMGVARSGQYWTQNLATR